MHAFNDTCNSIAEVAYANQLAHTFKLQKLVYFSARTDFKAVTLDVPTPEPMDTTDTFSIDIGMVNFATYSTGESFSGKVIDLVRVRMSAHRQCLQKRGTKSAKHRLKKLSGKQARFQKNSHHVISKRLVQKAKDNEQARAIEELRHIRMRTEARLRHSRRNRHANWSFAQLRSFLSYKAALAEVPLQTVDPRYTSRTCSACGHCTKENRKSQSSFQCVSCGYRCNADVNAAVNISRASVMASCIGARPCASPSSLDEGFMTTSTLFCK
jgi:IS605 OrfB family transposase